jgi:hypothetical protein
MKRSLVVLISVLILTLLSGCGEVKTFQKVSYQQSLQIDGRGDDTTPFTVYIFKSTEGKDIQVYDSVDSSYRELLSSDQLYDVTVSAGDRFSMSNYIKAIKKSV